MRKALFLIFLILVAPVVYAADCSFKPGAKSTVDFLAELPSLEAQLIGCPVPLDANARRLLGSNDAAQLTIDRRDGSLTKVRFTIAGGALSSVKEAEGAHSFEFRMDECTLDTILSADPRMGAFAYLYLQGKVAIIPKGFWNRIKFTLAKVFLNGAMKKQQTPVEGACKQENGAVCKHGGECLSGNCIGDGQGPPWTYRCSCDAFTYKASCPQAPTPVTTASGKRPAGELCEIGRAHV